MKNHQYQIYNYLESDQHPNELISKIPGRSFSNLLKFLRPYLNNLKGEDFDKFSELFNNTDLYDYLKRNLTKGGKKKTEQAAYYLGYSNSRESKELLRELLICRNMRIFLNSALSLAKKKDFDSIDNILSESKRFRNISDDTILSILIEFGKTVCERLSSKLESEDSDYVKSIIIRVFTHFKYYEGGKNVLPILVYTKNKILILNSLKFLGEIEYLGASNSLRFFLNHKKSDISSTAIRVARKIGDSSLEDLIFEKIYDNNWEVKIEAAETIYNYSEKGRNKLFELAYAIKNSKESSIARMIISEKTLLAQS